MDVDSRRGVDLEFVLVVDVAEPFDAIGNAEAIRLVLEVVFVGWVAVADDEQHRDDAAFAIRQLRVVDHHLPDVEKSVDAFLLVKPGAEDDAAALFLCAERRLELFRVHAAIVREEPALSAEPPWELAEVGFVGDDESSGAEGREENIQLCVCPRQQVQERGELVPLDQVLNDEGDEEKGAGKPTIAKLLLEEEARDGVGMEIADSEQPVVAVGVHLGQRRLDLRQVMPRCAYDVEFVVPWILADDMEVDVVKAIGDVPLDCLDLGIGNDEMNFVFLPQVPGHFQGDLGISAHCSWACQAHGADDKPLAHLPSGAGGSLS